MNLNQRPDPGTVVHLRPTTITAGAACRAYLPAVVVSYVRWPLVEVEIDRKGYQPRQIVHSDDIGLHPAKDKPRGDGVTQGARDDLPIPKPLYAKPRPLDLPEGWAEQSLF